MGKKILLITEKPKASERIADILGGGDAKVRKKGKAEYYQFEAGPDTLYVASALGHLYNLKEKRPSSFNRYPTFSVYWAKNTKGRRESVNDLLSTIRDLAEDADEFVSACDYDVEGSTIALNTIRFACGDGALEKASRMKFSSLTKEEILDAYEGRMDTLDWSQCVAGLTRHVLDFIWGINLTRALTLAAKGASGYHNTISVGRVQGPTLKFLVQREREIRSYIPTPYWKLTVVFRVGEETVEAKYDRGRIKVKKEAERVLDEIQDERGLVLENKRSERQYKVRPPFNLSGLQSQAYSNFGYSPSRALRIAEGLYLEGMITYPRTSSQKYPESLDHRDILQKLSKVRGYKRLSESLLEKEELSPVEGEKEDPAHPAIHPTGEKAERELRDEEKKLYDLIVRRYMATFSSPVVKERMKVRVDLGGHEFSFTGSRILDRGWMKYYGKYTNIKSKSIPLVAEDEEIDVDERLLEEKYTNPPSRYNPRSLLEKMEEEGIGTKATRSGIVDTLYSRKYVDGSSMEVSGLGIKLIETMEDLAPKIISLKLTREMESDMERIYEKEEVGNQILEKATENVLTAVDSLREHREVAGKELDKSVHEVLRQRRILGKCPKCEEGTMMIIRSKKSGKRFVGCTSYPKCHASMPLPQRGRVQSHKECEYCGWPVIKVSFSRTGFTSCVNLHCESREENE